MRYISAPHRSQSVGASDAGAGGSEVLIGAIVRTATGRAKAPAGAFEAEAGSDIGQIMAWLANRSSN